MFEKGGLDVGGHFAEGGSECGAVFGVGGEGVFRADALAFAVAFDRSRINAEGAFFQFYGEGSQRVFEGELGVLQIADGFEAALFEGLRGDGADAMNIADGEGAEKLHLVLLWNEREAVGLFVIAAEFCEELVGRDSDAGGEMALAADALFQINRGWQGETQGFVGICSFGGEVAYVEVGFVHGDFFEEGRKFGEHCHQVMGFVSVRIHAWTHKDGVGAESVGSARGHGGTHLETARFVTGGADDAALIGG